MKTTTIYYQHNFVQERASYYQKNKKEKNQKDKDLKINNNYSTKDNWQPVVGHSQISSLKNLKERKEKLWDVSALSSDVSVALTSKVILIAYEGRHHCF